MPLKAILNGYYRSGTTIMWWILRLSNLDKPILYEPTSPVLLDFLKKWEFGKVDGLHRLPVFDGYFMMPKPCLDNFMASQTGRDVYLGHENAFKTLNPIHNCNREIIIKTCQLHIILNKVANKYGCNYVHLVRHPADVFVSHLGKDYRSDVKLKLILDKKFVDQKIDGAFWLKSIYEKASQKLGVKVGDRDYVGKFIVAWTFCNYNALKQVEKSKRGLMVDFEDVVRRPRVYFALISDHLGVNVDARYSGLLDPTRAKLAPTWFKVKFIDRMEELGLWQHFQEIMGGCCQLPLPDGRGL